MNIGILTFHHTTNYGATLQAYALSRFIQDQGHDVEFINYQPEKAVKVYNDTLYFRARKREITGNLLKDLKMRWFVKKRMKVGKCVYSDSHSLKKAHFNYDAVFVGSDEVWNINSFRGYDTSYFLDFLSSKTRKISYAASFGSTISLADQKEAITDFISDFDRISVRDSNSLNLIQSECKANAEKVLDPTFLIDFEQIANKPKSKECVLIYGKIPEPLTASVKKVSTKLNLPIVSIGYANGIADANLLGVSPEEWLSCFSKANYIFTSFFHGTIFSILFKKPFTVFSAEQKKAKLTDLLTDLDLNDRIHSSTCKNDIDFSSIDYKLVFERVEEKRLTSKKFLLESLSHGN
ncbi:polysaccharide pyruvyl transferase family protein [filamentous cyanobacterium CCT1]|nr:polysaccharide pyruvyl transferase family protein [filamentous cyanobacterium CCT1]PSN79768.1 polysaccharide pyruvyl transferase family protein [filamentous cyanobacterium CCP4]